MTLPKDVGREIANVEAELARFLHGKLAPERWRAFRLSYGIYGQRQPGVQMVRIKIPAGIVSASQLKGLADLSERYATGVTHLTTRQDVQFYFVQLARVPDLLRAVAGIGLTTREACGNSVRNVTACPLSGAAADEAFDVRPYALAASDYLVRNPFCQQLARKFKIAFSSCPEDCAATAVHDVGFAGRVSGGRAGFKVLVGGGLGATPYVAETLYEFLPAREILRVLRAVLKDYAAHGNRRSKARARLKFVVHQTGVRAFRERVGTELANLSAEEQEEARLDVEGTLAPPPSAAARPRVPSDDLGFLRWQDAFVRPHRDADRAIALVPVPLGDLEAARLRALADLADRFSDGEARLTIDQNVVLPQVRRRDLPALYAALASPGGPSATLDVTSCPGTDTCALGITSSKGVSRAILRELEGRFGADDWDLLRGITVKVSGCPNGCGQHAIAAIGLHGVVRRAGERTMPAYQLHLGGRVGAGTARLGEAGWRIPARRAPEAVATLLERFRTGRARGEGFADFIDRLGERSLDSILRPYTEADPADAASFTDWGQESPFVLDVGAGECAGSGTDASADPFADVEAALLQAGLFLDRAQPGDALANLNRAQYALARALLEAFGKRPDSDYEALCAFRNQVIDRGYMDEAWLENRRAIETALRPRRAEAAGIRPLLDRAIEVLAEAREAHPRLAGRAAMAEAPS